MVRKILSDLVSAVRDGVSWGLAFTPPSRATKWLEPLAARPSSPSWHDDVIARSTKQRTELAARNRYGRFLDLTAEETALWASDPALRADCNAAARALAEAFRTPITIIACDGLELAIVEPSSQVSA